jgi:cell division protein FtsZ
MTAGRNKADDKLVSSPDPELVQDQIPGRRGKLTNDDDSEKRRMSLLKRLASVGLGRRESEEHDAQAPGLSPLSAPDTERLVSRSLPSIADITVESNSRISSPLFSIMCEFVLLELALLVGFVAAHGGHIDGVWKIISVVFGAVGLGFGMAVLTYRRLMYPHASKLEQAYKSLGTRAGNLLERAEYFARKLDTERNASAG